MRPKKFLQAFFFVFVLAAPCFSLTLNDLRFQVRRNIQDTPATQDQRVYGDTILNAMINDVQREIVNIVHPLTNTTTLTLVAGTTYYQLPTDYIDATQAVWTHSSNEKTRLYQISERVLVQQNPDYENHGGPPSQYMVRDSTYTATTLQMIFIPVPDSTSTGTVRVDYFSQVTDLSLGSDIPFNNLSQLYPYHNAIVFGVVARLKMKEGDAQGAALYQGLYEKAVKIMGDRLGERFDYNPGVSAARAR